MIPRRRLLIRMLGKKIIWPRMPFFACFNCSFINLIEEWIYLCSVFFCNHWEERVFKEIFAFCDLDVISHETVKKVRWSFPRGHLRREKKKDQQEFITSFVLGFYSAKWTCGVDVDQHWKIHSIRKYYFSSQSVSVFGSSPALGMRQFFWLFSL